MNFELKQLAIGCPESLQEEMREVITLSRKFLWNVDLPPGQIIEESRVCIQEAKNTLFSIIGRVITIVSMNYQEDDQVKKLGYRQKFETDLGEALSFLKEEYPKAIIQEAELTAKYLRYAGDLKMAWDFLVFYPFTLANKKKIKDEKEYFNLVFIIVDGNAGIIGKKTKVGLDQTARTLIPGLQFIKDSAMKENRRNGKESEEMNIGLPENMLDKEDPYTYHEYDEGDNTHV